MSYFDDAKRVPTPTSKRKRGCPQCGAPVVYEGFIDLLCSGPRTCANHSALPAERKGMTREQAQQYIRTNPFACVGVRTDDGLHLLEGHPHDPQTVGWDEWEILT